MDNVKVDNLVHIAHGVQVGRNSLVIANAMVAGSVQIGENTWVAPSSSIINQKKIGNNVTIGLSAVVVKNVEDGQTVIGSPAEEISKALLRKNYE
jgi:UDP-3-O-[3-hydroxymyristoyl] glucosamine N-acyltransferase